MSGMQWSSNSDKLINLAGATEYLQTLQEDIILLKLTWLTLFDLLAVCTAGSMSWHQKWRYLLWQWNTNKHYDPVSLHMALMLAPPRLHIEPRANKTAGQLKSVIQKLLHRLRAQPYM